MDDTDSSRKVTAVARGVTSNFKSPCSSFEGAEGTGPGRRRSVRTSTDRKRQSVPRRPGLVYTPSPAPETPEGPEGPTRQSVRTSPDPITTGVTGGSVSVATGKTEKGQTKDGERLRVSPRRRAGPSVSLGHDSAKS